MALVVGCGPSVFEELLNFRTQFPFAEYVIWAVNDVGMYIAERIHHLVCIDFPLFGVVRARRELAGYNTDYVTHSWAGHEENADVTWQFGKRISRNSGMAAIPMALGWGHKKVVTVGVPMDGSGHFYDQGSGRPTAAFPNILNRTPHARPIHELRASLRSMSGLTATAWGLPSKEWIENA